MHHESGDIHYWHYQPKHDTADQATPLLFIHGFTGNHAGFSDIIAQLGDKYDIYIPDLPGFGESALPQKPWTVTHLAQSINEWVKTVDFGEQKPLVIGHSMGGLVASRMLAQNPELFAQKAILISPVPTKIAPFELRNLGAQLGSLHYKVAASLGPFGGRLLRSRAISRISTRLIMTTKDRSLRHTIYQNHLDNLAYISDGRFYLNLHCDINKHGAIDDAELLKHRFDIMVITGDHDRVTPLRDEKELARALNADLRVIAGPGHLLHYETPTKVAAEIQTFLNQ